MDISEDSIKTSWVEEQFQLNEQAWAVLEYHLNAIPHAAFLFIDGAGGVGKGTIAESLADMEIENIEAGMFFRAAAWLRLQRGYRKYELSYEAFIDELQHFTLSVDLENQKFANLRHSNGTSEEYRLEIAGTGEDGLRQDTITNELLNEISQDQKVVAWYEENIPVFQKSSTVQIKAVQGRTGWLVAQKDYEPSEVMATYLWATREEIMRRSALRFLGKRGLNIKVESDKEKAKELIAPLTSAVANDILRSLAEMTRDKEQLMSPSKAYSLLGSQYDEVLDTTEMQPEEVAYLLLISLSAKASPSAALEEMKQVAERALNKKANITALAEWDELVAMDEPKSRVTQLATQFLDRFLNT